jgi:hypothetical protein
VPNHQLEASVEDLKGAQLTGLAPANDDINIKSSYGGRRRVVVASPEPTRGLQAAGWPVSGMVRVQMEESGEILDVESKYLEEVSPVCFLLVCSVLSESCPTSSKEPSGYSA